jgi:proline dehydrogenase
MLAEDAEEGAKAMNKFEELLRVFQHECIAYSVRGAITGGGEVDRVRASYTALVDYFAERTATKVSSVCGYATTANEAQMPVAHHGGNTGKDGAA